MFLFLVFGIRFVKVRIYHTNIYDGEYWGKLYRLDSSDKYFLVLRIVFMGLPNITSLGSIQLLPQFTLKDVPKAMLPIANDEILHL